MPVNQTGKSIPAHRITWNYELFYSKKSDNCKYKLAFPEKWNKFD
jgi:hypothetical protein